MEIEQYLYDLNDSGEAIVAYTMSSSSGGSVQLCNLGASVLSLTMPDGEGGLRDIAAGRCVKGLMNNNERFDERLWESRVEVNRVVMSLSYECEGVGLTVEVIFDFDDDDTFEVTYQACTSEGDLLFDLTHDLEFNLGGEVICRPNGERCHARGILSEVATIASSGSRHEITILSTQHELSVEGQKIRPVTSPVEVLREGERFIQKSLYRHRVK